MLTESSSDFKGFISWLQQANPDVICLQEIKNARADSVIGFQLAGYPYHYWFRLQKDTVEQLFLKLNLIKLFTGQGLEHMDFEGRNLRVDFDDLSVMSLYLPSGTNAERLGHKFMYMDDFQNYIDDLKKRFQI
jgi:exodeoxyribonuclease-3